MSKKKKSRKQLLDEIAAAYTHLGGRGNAVTPILYFALDGTLLLVNEPGARNLGGEPSDFVGKSISEIFPQKADVTIERIGRAAESGAGAKFIDFVELPSGERWFLTDFQPVKDANGKTIAAQLVSIDVTEWRDVEERADLLTKVVEQSSEGIAVVNMDGYLLFINEAFAAMHGYSPRELLGKHLSIFHSPDEQMPAVIASLKQLRETGEFEGEIWRVRRDGSVFPSLMHNTVLIDEAGNRTGIIGTLRDITDYKRAEEALRQSERDKALILGSLSELITYQDKNLKVIWVNKTAGDSVGQPPEELVGRYCYEIWHGRKQPCRDCPVAKSIESGQSHEDEITSPDGRIWHIRSSPVLNEQGDVVGAVEATLDITQRKKAIEELQKLAAVVRHSSELVNLATLDGKMIFLNEAGSKMLGIDPKEVEKCNIMQVIPDHLKQLVTTELLPTLKDSGTWEGELQYRNLKTGELTDVHAITFAVQDPLTSEPLYLANVSRDITERKRAEEALQASEQKHKTLVKNVPGMVYKAATDWSAEIISGSKEICGYTPDELNSKKEHWFGVIHPDDKKEVLQKGTQLTKERKSIVHAYRIIAKSGDVRWVEDHKTSLFSQKGQFVGIDGIVFDITERKKTARALEYRSNLEKIIMNISRQFINLSSEQIDDGVNQALKALGEFAEVDRSYIFQLFDEGRKTSNTHEWCAEGITPQIDNLQNISVDTLPWWMDKLGRFENIHILDVEKLPARAKNERQILQAQSIQSLIVIPMVYNRQLAGFVGFDSVRRKRTWSEESIAMLTIVSEIFVNVLMRERVGQELAVHHEKMRRAEQLASLGTVSATVAHELNQPLTVIRLFLQQGLRALKDDNDGDKVAEVINDCLSELTKAASIVDRFRRFARKSAPVYIAKVDLVEVANGIVEILAGTARREKLNLSVTVESCPPYIIGNSLELEQMFFVLIQNAIQAADGETLRELAITISSQGDQLHLTFADTCGGIRKEDIDKIFEPFFTTKPANLGTGLGLCILERIVKRHGGSVRVESRIGRGTIFYICLPIKS